MKKAVLLIIFLLFCVSNIVFAKTVLQSGVEIKYVPNYFYGCWRVSSVLAKTNNELIFKNKNIDIWNISREGSVIKLENPFSGASQTVTIKNAKPDFIKFTKTGHFDGKILTDEVTLNLNKNTFWGVNELKLDTISDIDGHIIKTEYATYNLKGEKISGTSVGE